MTRLAFVSFVLSLASIAGIASAQPSAEAEVLFTQGRELLEQERYAEACDKFEASRKIEASSGTVLNLAVCYQKVGRTASAWLTYREAAALARRDNHPDRERMARAQIALLEPTLTKVTVVVSSRADVPGLEVQRDGVEVSRAAWGQAIPIDPGEHRMRASAPGRTDWEQTVSVASGAKNIVVEIPLLEEPAPSTRETPARVKPPAKSRNVRDPRTAEGTAERTGSTRRTLAFVAGGVGVAALGLTGYFAWRAKDKDDESREDCDVSDANSCGDRGQELRADAQRAGNMATIFGIVGGAALTGAVVLYLTAPGSRTAARRLELRVGHGSGGAVLLRGPLF